MFRIFDGRDSFFQWDLNRRLIVEDNSINEVHFSNKTDDSSLVCVVRTEDGLRVADVPNILLQTDWSIRAYAYCTDHTIVEEIFKVHSRTKPADYIYTETEIKNYDDLKARVDEVGNRLAALSEDKISKKQSVDNAGKFLAIGEDGVVKPDDVVVPERHVVLLSYNSSTKKYTVNQSYSTMNQWLAAGDTVVLSLNGTIYNLCEQVEGDRLAFVYVRAYTDGQIKIYTAIVYTTDSVGLESVAGYMMPNNNDGRNEGLVPVATRYYQYKLTDLSNVVIKSSTDGSTKKFKLSVDDNGTISATEVTA